MFDELFQSDFQDDPNDPQSKPTPDQLAAQRRWENGTIAFAGLCLLGSIAWVIFGGSH